MKTNKDRIFWIFALCVSIVLSLVSFELTELYIFLLFKATLDSTGFYNWHTAIIGILDCLACWWSVWYAYDNLNRLRDRS